MTNPPASTPRWIRALARALPVRYREEVLADLLEERDAMIAAGRSRPVAGAWLVGHLVRSAVASRRAHSSFEHRVGAAPSAGNWRILAAGEWRQAIRSLRRTPAYAASVIAVTALTMALASTVFAVVDGVLFKALPYPDPDELYVVRGRYDGGPPDRRGGMVSPNEVSRWSAAAPGVSITSIGYTSVAFPDGRIAFAAAIDRRFYDVFGVRILMGGFSDQDYLVAAPVMPVVISHRLWREVFEGDPGVVGRMVPPFGPFSRTFQIVGSWRTTPSCRR